MYRVLFVLSGGLLLAACSSSSDWLSMDGFKSAPMPWNALPLMDTVQFETEPAEATATLSTGQNCKTPCSLSVPVDKPFSVTFTLNGYQPASEQVESVLVDGSSKLRPNPVTAELTPAPPPPKPPKKKPVRKKTSAAKPATPKPAATTAAAPPPPAATAPPPAPAVSSPWPSTTPKQ